MGGILHLANLFRDGIALGLERLHLDQQGAALFIQFQDGIDRGRVILAVPERLADHVGVFADQIDV